MEKARQKIDRNKAALCTRFISLTEGNTFIKCMNLQGSKFATIEEVKTKFTKEYLPGYTGHVPTKSTLFGMTAG